MVCSPCNGRTKARKVNRRAQSRAFCMMRPLSDFRDFFVGPSTFHLSLRHRRHCEIGAGKGRTFCFSWEELQSMVHGLFRCVHISSGTESDIAWVQRLFKPDAKLIADSVLVQGWFEVYSNSIRGSLEFGSRLIRIWFKVDSNLVRG